MFLFLAGTRDGAPRGTDSRGMQVSITDAKSIWAGGLIDKAT